MNKEELKNRINTISIEIHNLRVEKSDLELELINLTETFSEKFKSWWESDLDIEPQDWVPSEREFPYLRSLLDKMECDRHKLYDLTEYLEVEMSYVTDPQDINYSIPNYFAEKLGLDPTFLYTCIATELFKGKLKAFTYDW